MLRVAIARIAHETNAHAPVAVELADFARHHLLVGDAILRACQPGGNEVPGFLRRAEIAGAMDVARAHRDVEIVPTVSAWTVPAGPLSRATFDTLRALFTDRLQAAGRLDGVLLVLHGAMLVNGVDDPEAVLLADAREAVGAGGVVAATFDAHAHITASKVDAADVIVGYRTNPHRDHARTGAEGMTLLLQALRRQIQPTTTWRSLPMVTGGGTTLDFSPSMLRIRWAMAQARRRSGVLSVNLFLCQPWSLAPDLGWAVQVLTDGDPALADTVADELADVVWAARHKGPPEALHPEDAIDRVRRRTWLRRLGCACFVDTSDVVGGGAVGDHTGLLRALLEHARDLSSFVPLKDEGAVAALWDLPVGEAVALKVGATHTADWAPPIDVAGKIRAHRETEVFGRIVLLDLGPVQLALTSRAPFTIRPDFWTELGLSPRSADIVVVKSLFLWLPAHLPVVRHAYLVKTGGPTDFDHLHRIAFDGPVHPKDHVDDWRDADRRRRLTPKAVANGTASILRSALSLIRSR